MNFGVLSFHRCRPQSRFRWVAGVMPRICGPARRTVFVMTVHASCVSTPVGVFNITYLTRFLFHVVPPWNIRSDHSDTPCYREKPLQIPFEINNIWPIRETYIHFVIDLKDFFVLPFTMMVWAIDRYGVWNGRKITGSYTWAIRPRTVFHRSVVR